MNRLTPEERKAVPQWAADTYDSHGRVLEVELCTCQVCRLVCILIERTVAMGNLLEAFKEYMTKAGGEEDLWLEFRTNETIDEAWVSLRENGP